MTFAEIAESVIEEREVIAHDGRRGYVVSVWPSKRYVKVEAWGDAASDWYAMEDVDLAL